MLREVGFGGMLFSPLVVLVPLAFGLVLLTRLFLHQLDVQGFIWKQAWFEVSLFVCYLAVVVYLFGS